MLCVFPTFRNEICFVWLGFPSGGGGNPITSSSGGFKDAKNDLIAELKLSHTVGGISKLKSEQQKLQEEQEKEQYKLFLAQFTMENFLEKVSYDETFFSEFLPSLPMQSSIYALHTHV